MSNYPPGTSAGDPRAPWNAPDRSHEHEWRPCEPDYPLFEDGAAVFVESCNYAEGRYGDGWQCEEMRSLRCDVERVVLKRENEPDVAYLASEENPSENWSFFELLYEDALCTLEIADFEGIKILDCDPPNDYGDGYVRVAIGDKYEVVYEQ